MKKIILLAIVILSQIISACQSEPTPVTVTPVPAATDPAVIKGATILITIESLRASSVGLGYGIGTLVQRDGEILLVTHNHWGDFLQDKNIVTLRDPENHLIKPIYASEFKQWIIYQDAGTLVLQAPQELSGDLTPASLEQDVLLQVGDPVQVTCRERPGGNRLLVHEALVEEVSTFEGEPIYKLRSQDGQPLQPGDSGGGVWHDGKLVANNWAVRATYSTVGTSGEADPTNEVLTTLSYAAIFPQDFH